MAYHFHRATPWGCPPTWRDSAYPGADAAAAAAVAWGISRFRCQACGFGFPAWLGGIAERCIGWGAQASNEDCGTSIADLRVAMPFAADDIGSLPRCCLHVAAQFRRRASGFRFCHVAGWRCRLDHVVPRISLAWPQWRSQPSTSTRRFHCAVHPRAALCSLMLGFPVDAFRFRSRRTRAGVSSYLGTRHRSSRRVRVTHPHADHYVECRGDCEFHPRQLWMYRTNRWAKWQDRWQARRAGMNVSVKKEDDHRLRWCAFRMAAPDATKSPGRCVRRRLPRYYGTFAGRPLCSSDAERPAERGGG